MFEGGRLTSVGGVLLLAQIERRRGLADRRAKGVEDARNSAAVHHSIAEMIRYRAPLIETVGQVDVPHRSCGGVCLVQRYNFGCVGLTH